MHSSIKTLRIGDLRLASGADLPDVEIAYVSHGRLNANGDNCVLVTHGLTGSPAMLLEGPGNAEGSWVDLLRPGAPLDMERYFVVCSNVIGSALGSTGPACVNPGSGRPWGAEFPSLTLSDMVAAQHRMLSLLGVHRLKAVVGPSYGGMQALQWALDHPAMVEAIGVVVSGLHWPRQLDPDALVERLRRVAGRCKGLHARDATRDEMQKVRVETLQSYGFEALYLSRDPDPERCRLAMQRAANAWAQQFDADALVCLQQAGAAFDVRDRIAEIACKVLFVIATSDRLFPPNAEVRKQLAPLGERLHYLELDTPYGHLASSPELPKWAPALHALLGT